MKVRSRIRINLATKEIEIEGTEEFVKIYFNKIQEILSGASETIKQEPAPVKANLAKKLRIEYKTEVLPVKKTKNGFREKVDKNSQMTTMFNRIVGIIKGSKGITTAELKNKTGLTEKQIWSITYRAAKRGMIKIAKKGIYEAAVR